MLFDTTKFTTRHPAYDHMLLIDLPALQKECGYPTLRQARFNAFMAHLEATRLEAGTRPGPANLMAALTLECWPGVGPDTHNYHVGQGLCREVLAGTPDNESEPGSWGFVLASGEEWDFSDHSPVSFNGVAEGQRLIQRLTRRNRQSDRAVALWVASPNVLMRAYILCRDWLDLALDVRGDALALIQNAERKACWADSVLEEAH